MSNQHISQFLDYYINLSNPQYAVLLKGKWGSGKTHFINKYKDKLKENKQRYIYVSLYGVTNYDEIETKFLQSSNPEMFNEKTIFAGKLANVFINENIKESLGQIKKILSSLNAKGNILIFDDLERCSINIIDLLGYINNFVEHQSYKVILIANEEELEKTEKYTLIKEKLVGKTFEFKTDANLAYDSFLSELKNENRIKENILEKEKSNILELFKKSEFKNLRALRQTLLDFERFYDEVLISHLLKEELIKDILYCFFLFSFEIRQGNNEILKLDEFRGKHILSLSNGNTNKEKTKFEIYNDKYNLGHFNEIISFNLWKEILLNSNIQKDEIDLSLRNSKYYFDENTPSWKKLADFHELKNDDEFDKLITNVYDDFLKSYCENINQYKLISSMLLYFYEEKLFDIAFDNLDMKIKQGLDLLYKNKKENLKKYIFNEIIRDSSYENISYFTSKKFDDLNKYITKYFDKKKVDILTEDSKLIINAIVEQNTDELLKLLESSKYEKEISYYNKAIFVYIDLDELFEALIKTNSTTLHFFGGIIKDRYFKRREELFEEKTFLNKLLFKTDEYLESSTDKLSSYHIRKELESNFKIALENIEKLSNENSGDNILIKV